MRFMNIGKVVELIGRDRIIPDAYFFRNYVYHVENGHLSEENKIQLMELGQFIIKFAGKNHEQFEIPPFFYRAFIQLLKDYTKSYIDLGKKLGIINPPYRVDFLFQ